MSLPPARGPASRRRAPARLEGAIGQRQVDDRLGRMPAPEQIVFPAVQVLGIEHVDPRTDDLVPFDGPNVVPEQVGPDTPDQRDALELGVGGERRERPHRVPGAGRVMCRRPRKRIEEGADLRGHDRPGPSLGAVDGDRAVSASSRSARRRSTVSSHFWAQSMPVQYHGPAGSGQDRSAGGPAWPRQMCSSSPGEKCSLSVASDIRSTAAGSMVRPSARGSWSAYARGRSADVEALTERDRSRGCCTRRTVLGLRIFASRTRGRSSLPTVARDHASNAAPENTYMFGNMYMFGRRRLDSMRPGGGRGGAREVRVISRGG